jgi:nucleoid-associated protein EbfC
MFDMMKMMGKVREVQEKMKEVQENLVHIKASAEAGAGMVKATVNGKKQLVDLVIDNDLIKPEDKDMLKDLIIAAVNKAMVEADVKAKEEIRKQTEGIIPNIPGLDLNGMFNA